MSNLLGSATMSQRESQQDDCDTSTSREEVWWLSPTARHGRFSRPNDFGHRDHGDLQGRVHRARGILFPTSLLQGLIFTLAFFLCQHDSDGLAHGASASRMPSSERNLTMAGKRAPHPRELGDLLQQIEHRKAKRRKLGW